MRTTLIAGLIALVLPACIVGGELTGVGGGEGEGEGEGEGSGSGSGSGSGTTLTPRITATVDKTTVMTELGKTENLIVTVQGADGFAGTVNVTPSLMDGTTPITTGFAVTAAQPSVTLTENGSATVMLSVQIPTDAAVLMPTLKVDLGGTATTSVSSAFNIAQRLVIEIPAGVGTGSHLAALPLNRPINLRPGTQVVFHNGDDVQHVIHANDGIGHQNLAQGMPGTDYMVTPTGDATWYCHNHEGNSQLRVINLQ